jgi:hypothetical protein
VSKVQGNSIEARQKKGFPVFAERLISKTPELVSTTTFSTGRAAVGFSVKTIWSALYIPKIFYGFCRNFREITGLQVQKKESLCPSTRNSGGVTLKPNPFFGTGGEW